MTDLDPEVRPCAIHEKIEVTAGDRSYYTICFECGHVYKTEEELIAWWNHEHPSSGSEPWMDNTSEIYFCPLCMHDF